MTRTRLLPAALLVAALSAALVGCGTETAVDPDAADTPQATPSATPTIGDHPAYPYADYAYDLEVRCFCPAFGQPVRVTVVDGEVVDAVWTRKGQGHAPGDAASEEWLQLSINDILTEAADPKWDEVEVDWPAGQDHPDRVSIDRIKKAMDDEVTYLLTNVTPAA